MKKNTSNSKNLPWKPVYIQKAGMMNGSRGSVCDSHSCPTLTVWPISAAVSDCVGLLRQMSHCSQASSCYAEMQYTQPQCTAKKKLPVILTASFPSKSGLLNSRISYWSNNIFNKHLQSYFIQLILNWFLDIDHISGRAKSIGPWSKAMFLLAKCLRSRLCSQSFTLFNLNFNILQVILTSCHHLSRAMAKFIC